VRTILPSLVTKITDNWWLPSLPRQNQQYWYRGLRLQALRINNIVFPDMETLQEIVSNGFVPVSHSFDCAMLRLSGHPRRLCAAILSSDSGTSSRKPIEAYYNHGRSFGRYQKIEHPSHRERLPTRTPHGKYERIYHLMTRIGKEIGHFLAMAASEGEDGLRCAYGLFRLLKSSSKEMLLSAVREANTLHTYKLRYLENLLGPRDLDPGAVYPQNASLLHISYEKRELTKV
jgi:hypothetical protein